MMFVKGIYHWLLALFGGILYGSPSKKLFVVGVTGTNGKSTTIELINSIFEQHGLTTALSSSVRVKVADDVTLQKNSMTMPGRFFLQRFLKRAVKAGCTHAIVEVTSEGVRQHRHKHIHFDAAIVTNVSPEHIESHGSFKKYVASKVRFFKDAAHASRKKDKLFIVNAHDENKGAFKKAARNQAIREFSPEWFHEKIGDPVQINPLFQTSFNVENAAAASLLAIELNVNRGTILQALSEFRGVPGRMEYIQREPFSVVVDLALTPKALEGVYASLRSKIGDTQSLICVLGAAGGGRDTWKRPELGKLAERYCNVVIISDDEPYDEDPQNIREAIMSEMTSRAKVHDIPDRKMAISEAVSVAKSGDTVVITGMGDLRIRHFARGKTISWSDRRAAEEALAKVRE